MHSWLKNIQWFNQVVKSHDSHLMVMWPCYDVIGSSCYWDTVPLVAGESCVDTFNAESSGREQEIKQLRSFMSPRFLSGGQSSWCSNSPSSSDIDFSHGINKATAHTSYIHHNYQLRSRRKLLAFVTFLSWASVDVHIPSVKLTQLTLLLTIR